MMKKTVFKVMMVFVGLLMFSSGCFGQTQPRVSGEESMAQTPEKMEWWLNDKFGMFIHWGPSSVAGVEIGWARQPSSSPWAQGARQQKPFMKN